VPFRERILIVALEDLTDERLREAFALRIPDSNPDAPCPEAETLWQAVRRELSHERIRQIGLHVTTCAECAEDWRLAREVAREVPADVIPFEQSARPLSRARQWWIGGTLAAAAALVLFAVLLPGGPTSVPTGQGILRGAEEIIAPARDLATPLTRESCTLRWQGPTDSRWEIRVATDDLRVIAEAHDLKAPEFTVPAQALADLPPGTKIVWQVHANLPDGRRLASRSFVQTLE
jgi:hypothetical protein